MGRVFGKPLITQEEMRARIRELGKEITRDYREKDVVLVGVLKGAFAFFADLVRVIRLPIQVDFLMVQSGRPRRGSTGTVKVLTDVTEEIRGRHVLLVEDIVDSGLTVQALTKRLGRRKPQSIEICALLSKSVRRQVDIHVRYVGFEIPNEFVVGYGLDYRQKYRNLPYVAVLDSSFNELS